MWERTAAGNWLCGNVAVIQDGGSWYIHVRGRYGWGRVFPAQRPWGYGHAGQAKIGAALMAKHQRNT
jgi:hypothetical protein